MLVRFLLVLGLLTAAINTPAEQRILLINHPKVHSKPSEDAPGTATKWEAGKRITVSEKKSLGGEGGLAENAWWRIDGEKAAGWLPDAYLAPPPQKIESKALGVIGTETVDRFHGIPPEYHPTDLEPVGPLYDKEVKAQLRKAAAAALAKMVAAARRDKVKLAVVSGYRSWTRQQDLYEKRVHANGLAQNTVAKPGHSEHQLGTAVDLTDGDEKHLLEASFGQTPAGTWLREHAWEYGFAVSFTEHNRAKTGCAPEPWHYRYWGPDLAHARHMSALGEATK